MTESADIFNLSSEGEPELGDPQYDRMRATYYGVLGRLYGNELTLEFVNELHRVGFFGKLARINGGLNGAGDGDSLDYDRLAVEYARLFIGPGPHIPPYASVHREDDDRTGELWGKTTGEVRRFMEHYGLKPAGPGVVPDHISILFEFMEKLILEKLRAFERNDTGACQEADKIQRNFFLGYIEPWVESFSRRILGMEPLPFYAAVVRLTGQFMEHERTMIKNSTD